jgi:hypothetical protein
MSGRTILGLACVLGLCGCGPRIDVVPVEGTVKLNGKPLAGVEVRFAPETDPDAASAPFSRAFTDANGHFNLECDNKKPGAVTGKHVVIVRRLKERPDPANPKPPPPSGPPIPAPYQSFTSTPLFVVVKADNRVYDFNLNSAGK